MGLISTTIPNLINGVSQQPYAMRLASQCDEQINAYSSVVDGLGKRPATKHIARLSGISGSAYIHTISRDATEKYILVIQNGSIRVFDITGAEKTVNTPNGVGYLSATSPVDNFRCVTVADYTFILNTSKVVKASSTLSATRPYEALVWVRQGSYGAKYVLTVNGTTVTFTAPDGSVASHTSQVTTDYIATQLTSSITTALGTGWVITRYGSTIYIKRTTGASFTISTDDSIGDHGIEVVVSKIQRFSDLPARAVSDFVVQVVGDQTSSFGNYYVKYDTSGTGSVSGVWKETLKGGETIGFDVTTMPHALVRNEDGSFTFKVMDWAERAVGDLDSNPMPSFVDRKINDIFFHRNRLGVIADENIVFSRAGDYFNFFINTATTMLDDDPIDIGVSHTKVSILRHAIPFNETLLLFSDKTQFQLGKAELLTPDSVSINQTTEYECSLKAKPVGAGKYVYFAVNRGSYTGIREYYVDGQTEAEEASDITGHVPKYIEGGVFKIATSGNEDILAVVSEKSKNTLFVYRYYWSGNEKLQSSWSKWVFGKGDVILNCDFIESELYILFQRADGVHLEYINLESGAVEPNWDIHVHLDSCVTEAQCTRVFNAGDASLEGDDTTTVTLPYKAASTDTLQLVCGVGGSRKAGVIFSDYTIDNSGSKTVLTLKGNWTTQPFFIGKVYEMRYRFSTINIKEEAVGGGQMTVGEGRIQLRRVSLLYNDTGYFRVEVTPSRRDTYTYTFSGRVVGSGKNLIGQVSIEEGKFRFPIGAKNDQVTIEVVNDSFLPCHFLSAEWEAFYAIRSQRL